MIQGAGLWHTGLLFTSAEPRGSGFLGVGGNVTVADCSVTGTTAARISTRGFSGCFGTGSAIREVEFADNSISGAGEYGIFVHDGAVGEISLVRTVIERGQTGEISNQSMLEILTR